MNFGLGNASKGLPALLGVMLGIRSYTGGSSWIWGCIAMILAAAVLMRLGRAMMHRWPRVGRWLIEVWVLAAIGVAALAAAFILWLGLAPLPAFIGIAGSDDAKKAISGAFVGAVTTYVALVWTKDVSDATGYFWPSAQFKVGMSEAYEAMANKPAGGSATSETMFEDTVTGHGGLGWGFHARGIRAGILADFL
jgi:hypothetical protein